MKTGMKLISMNLALVLLLGLVTPAFAEDGGTQIPAETPPAVTETLPPEETAPVETPVPEETPLPEETPIIEETASLEQEVGAEQQAADTTYLYIDGDRVYDNAYEDTYWYFCDSNGLGTLYLRNGFSCKNIEALGSLNIRVSGTATINAYAYLGPAIETGGALNIVSNEGSAINIYGRATATNRNCGITAGGPVSIKSDYSTVTIEAKYSSSSPDAQPAGISALGNVTLTGVGGTISAKGNPAVLSSGLEYSLTTSQTMVGTDSNTAAKGTYARQKYLRVEPREVTVYLNGNGGATYNGTTRKALNQRYGDYLDTSNFLAFEKAESRLIGWSSIQNGVGELGTWFAAKEELMPVETGDDFIDIYAQWSPKTGSYDALFDAWGCTFEDGRGAKLICTAAGKQLAVPSLDVVGATLLGWQEHPKGLSEKAKWYFPGTTTSPAVGQSFYAVWAYGDETYWEYNGGGGVSVGGTDKLYQTIRDTTTDLVLYGDTAFTRKDGRPFGGWNTEADWSGNTFAAKDRVIIDLSVGKVPLYAMWGASTQSALTLRSTSIPYTGKGIDLSGNATTTVIQDSNVINNPSIRYEYYNRSGIQLLEAPTHVGSYKVRARYFGDQVAGYLPSETATKDFSITKGTAQIVLPATKQTALWTGGEIDIQAPVVTMNGVPTAIGTQYKYQQNGGYYNGLPTGVGTYSVQATLAATGDYSAVTSEPFALTIANFVAKGGVVKGNVDVNISAQQTGACTAIVALYRAGTNRLLAVAEKPVTINTTSSRISLRNITLNASAAPGDVIKIMFIDKTKGFKPVATPIVGYKVA